MSWSRKDDHQWQNIKKPQPFRRLIPNLITLTGLCCGLSAIRFGFAGEWEKAVAFIIAAAVIDGMDGRAARMLRATSLFGAQLDSLSDFVCFGVAPALVLYMWGTHEVKALGWAATLFFAICCALRLARFNTAVVENKQQAWQKQFFVGVPSPAGGIICLLPLIISLQLDESMRPSPILVILHMLMMAVLMASRLPTFAAKHVRIRPDYILPVMIVCAFLVVMLVIDPWLSISGIGVAYLCSIPVSVYWYRRLRLKHQKQESSELIVEPTLDNTV